MFKLGGLGITADTKNNFFLKLIQQICMTNLTQLPNLPVTHYHLIVKKRPER